MRFGFFLFFAILLLCARQQEQPSLQSIVLVTLCRTSQMCRSSITAPPTTPCNYPFAVLCNATATATAPSPDSCFVAKSQCPAACAQCASVALLTNSGALPLALPTELALDAPPAAATTRLPPGGTGVIDVGAAFLSGSHFACAPTDTWAPGSVGTCNATQCALSCSAVLSQSQGRCMRSAISPMCDCVCATAVGGESDWQRVARQLRTASPSLWARAIRDTVALPGMRSNVTVAQCSVQRWADMPRREPAFSGACVAPPSSLALPAPPLASGAAWPCVVNHVCVAPLALSAAAVGSAVVYEFDVADDDSSNGTAAESITCFGVGGDGRLVRIASGITRVCWGRSNGFPRIRCDTGAGSAPVATRIVWTFKASDDSACRPPFAPVVDPNVTVAGLGNSGIRTSLQLDAGVGFVAVRSDAVARNDTWLVVGSGASVSCTSASSVALPARTALRLAVPVAQLVVPDAIGFELRLQWTATDNATSSLGIALFNGESMADTDNIARITSNANASSTISMSNLLTTTTTLFVSREKLLAVATLSSLVTLTVSNENAEQTQAPNNGSDTDIYIDEMRLSTVGIWRGCVVAPQSKAVLPFYSATVVGATSDATQWHYRAVDKSPTQVAQFTVSVGGGVVSLAQNATAASLGTVALFKTIDLQSLTTTTTTGNSGNSQHRAAIDSVLVVVEWRGRRSQPSTDPFRAFFAALDGTLNVDNSTAFAPGRPPGECGHRSRVCRAHRAV